MGPILAEKLDSTEMTYAQLLKETATQLKRLGVPNFDQEARWILSFAAGRDNTRLAAELNQTADGAVKKKVEEVLRQRSTGRPLVYVTGETEFYGRRFKIGPAVLIPRPETECLVAEVLRQLKANNDRQEGLLMLDVGTGSGCIALTLLSELPRSRAVATDISLEALRLAAENARALGLESRVWFVQANLLKPLQAAEKFDLVVSNPPYIDPSEMDSLDPAVREFEPTVAIESPQGGTWFHGRLAREAPAFLKPGAVLAFEVGNRQSRLVCGILKKTGLYETPKIYADLSGYERVVLARRK